MKKEYIERGALIEEIRSLQVTVTGLRSGKGVLNQYARFYRDSVERAIVEAPDADVVEVVRCKDCVYGKNNYLAHGLCLCQKPIYDGVKGEMPANILMDEIDYCSTGERKEK